ncbi:MAG: hypothetical protein Q7S12_04740 [bacterium]|nr:hypothetical protein [bacterium]
MSEKNTKQSLLNLLNEAKAKVLLLEEKIKAESLVIRAAVRKKTSAENELHEKIREMFRLKELLIVEAGLPSELVKWRENIIAKMQKSQRKDITIEQKESLEKEVEQRIQNLRQFCPHNFVLSYDCYEGSYTHDYEDSRYGHRRCVACTYFDQSKSVKENVYETLFESESRLVKRDLRHMNNHGNLNSSDEKKDIWQDLAIFLKLFEESAGRMNIDGLAKIKMKNAS